MSGTLKLAGHLVTMSAEQSARRTDGPDAALLVRESRERWSRASWSGSRHSEEREHAVIETAATFRNYQRSLTSGKDAVPRCRYPNGVYKDTTRVAPRKSVSGVTLAALRMLSQVWLWCARVEQELAAGRDR